MSFEFFEVVPVDEALARWRRALADHVPATPPAPQPLDLSEALGLALAAGVRAEDDVPGFDRSTVDGYAVAAPDTFGASEAHPAYLRVIGEVPMGAAATVPLRPGAAVKVSTGGMLPAGADAAVMIEYCETLPTGEIALSRAASPGENIVRRGEDVRCGDLVLDAGHMLRPQDLGMLAAVGVTKVAVHRRPRVAVISTGDEVVDPASRPGPGQVRDINSHALAAMVREAGGVPVSYGIVPDDPAAMRAVFGRAVAECELLLVSGGSSVGARDYVSQTLAELGEPGVLVHGLALRPGKPTLLAVAGRVPVIGLPGHPTSALVVLWLFGHVALRHLGGCRDERVIRPSVRARLSRNLPSAPGREDYVRVVLAPAQRDAAPHPAWLAEPVFGASGLVRTLVHGDGLVRVPHGSEGLVAGTDVDVLLFGGGTSR